MTDLLLLVLAGLLVLACAVFVAAEFAFVTVNRSALSERAEAGDARARGAMAALKKLSSQLSAAQLGITVTNLGIGFLAQPAIAELIEPGLVRMGLEGSSTEVSVVLALAIATALTMVFGELVPKNLAISEPLATSRIVAGPMRAFAASTSLLVRICNGSANAIVRRLGFEPSEELASARDPRELSALVRHSAQGGVLDRDTAELVERSLAFGDRRARDVMTPRGMMETLEETDPVALVLKAAGRGGHSRFPVTDGDGLVVGVVQVRDVLNVSHAERGVTACRDVMREPAAVPDTIPLDALLDTLRDESLQLALVVDEFGDHAGLVTFEDLVEELVGEVRDEHDSEEDAHLEEDGTWVLDGQLRPDRASELLGVGVPTHEDYDTLAGLVVLHLERMPEVGDVVVVDAELSAQRRARGIELVVKDLDGHRIEHLGVRVVAKEES